MHRHYFSPKLSEVKELLLEMQEMQVQFQVRYIRFRFRYGYRGVTEKGNS